MGVGAGGGGTVTTASDLAAGAGIDLGLESASGRLVHWLQERDSDRADMKRGGDCRHSATDRQLETFSS